ncbi:MAG: fructose-6-phosphate aldolase [Sphaerochaeta sp.]|jgi:transaldolase|nr:fructose-6-phosphate aldolase [Sphaerochaeta sp.]MCH3920578.1 fructose-6-phosphate aldolase [Sphaerochaeta sp.]MCI2096614.1 fructose-6-phosphate aldolase [Sphaerochaeta sp.]
MELLLDTADLKEITEGLRDYPVFGVTTNPTIFQAEGEIDFFERLREIRGLIGAKRSLHVQVVGDTADQMVKEAERIRFEVDDDVWIKIPVTEAGLQAIRRLSAQGVNITATAILSPLQGLLAMMAGARTLAVYYNRMQTNGEDPEAAIRLLSSRKSAGCTILAASLKGTAQIIASYAAGADACTVSPALLHQALIQDAVVKAVDGFRASWHAIHGDALITDL